MKKVIKKLHIIHYYGYFDFLLSYERLKPNFRTSAQEIYCHFRIFSHFEAARTQNLHQKPA